LSGWPSYTGDRSPILELDPHGEIVAIDVEGDVNVLRVQAPDGRDHGTAQLWPLLLSATLSNTEVAHGTHPARQRDAGRRNNLPRSPIPIEAAIEASGGGR